jgi:hypothetical protein
MPVRTHISHTTADSEDAILGLGIDEDDAVEVAQAEIDAHEALATAAHAATAVSVNSADLTGTAVNVQASLVELDDLLDTTKTTADAAISKTIVDAAGDLIVGSAADTVARLAKGSAMQTLRTNAGATALEWGSPVRFSYLTSDSADIQNDTLTESGLSVTLEVGTYRWKAVVLVTSDADADINLKMAGGATVTAATSFTYTLGGVSGDSTVARVPEQLSAWNTEKEFVYTGDIADVPFVLEGVVVTTVAGTLTVQFAQGTTTAINTHIDKGSYLEAYRVA